MATLVPLPVVLFCRRMSVKPVGAVIVAVAGRMAMMAIRTSPLAVPVGRVIVMEVAWPFWSREAALRKAMAAWAEPTGSTPSARAATRTARSQVRVRDAGITGGATARWMPSPN